MNRSRSNDVKREQKKSLFFRELSTFFQELTHDEPSLSSLYINRVDLSADGGICYVYFSSFQDPGQDVFNQLLPTLKLYKPSMRKAFAHTLRMRYVPDFMFVYDKAKEKERKINVLLDQVQQELDQQEHDDAQQEEE
ncbi:MAG: ribosome-binding factor A [Epsilonproteobacteria bacterium]|nr:ribosome-binding factor A [Campylobacterota bacterium]